MTIGERIRLLRKTLDMTQAEFGAKINLRPTTIGLMENNVRNTTDRTIYDICKNFSVSESWLKNELGDIFVENDSAVLALLQKEYNLPSDQLAVVESFLSISNDQREAITAYLENLCGRLNVTSQGKESDLKYDDDWKKRELAEYAAELDAQEKGLLVSDGSVNFGTKKKKAKRA